MFITPSNRRYTENGQQKASGRFLVLVQPPGFDGGKVPIRALVRHTHLEQCGHFMMGFVIAFGHKLTVSGTYGSDGLPMSVPQEVYDRATPVPQHLIEAWNKGGGWTSAGSEAVAMRDWAIATFPKPA